MACLAVNNKFETSFCSLKTTAMVVTTSNFAKICRLCLSEKPNLNSLYQQNLVQKLSECTTLKVDRKDDLPKMICSLCMCQLNTSYMFKKLCESSDAELRQFVLDRKEEPAIENSEEEEDAMSQGKMDTSHLSPKLMAKSYATDEESNGETQMKKRRRLRCVYCKKLVYHFQRHLITTHQDEEEVKEFLVYPMHSKERAALVTNIKKQANTFYNVHPTKKGTLMGVRKPARGKTNFVGKKTFVSPSRNFKEEDKGHVSVQKEQEEEEPDDENDNEEEEDEGDDSLTTKPSTSHILATYILPLMRNDSVLEEIKSDPLILMYGSELCDRRDIKERSVQIRVRNSIRQMARLLLGMKKANENITQLMDIFDIKYFEILKEIVDEVAEFNSETNTYAKEYLAAYFAAGIRKCAKIVISNAVIRRNEALKTTVENYLQFFDVEFNKWFRRTKSTNKDNSMEEEAVKVTEVNEAGKVPEELESSSALSSSEEDGGEDGHEPNGKEKKLLKREREEGVEDGVIEMATNKRKYARRSWSTPEMIAVRKHFVNIMDTGALPTREEVVKCLSQEPCLEGRTWQQVKAWISNQHRRNKGNKKELGNSTPDVEVE